MSLPPVWMNHTDTGYSGNFEGGKQFTIPLNVMVILKNKMLILTINLNFWLAIKNNLVK